MPISQVVLALHFANSTVAAGIQKRRAKVHRRVSTNNNDTLQRVQKSYSSACLFTSLLTPVKHFIFSYGSLVNPQSRLRSLPPSKQTNLSLPVYVTNFHRSWSYNCNNNYTAVGVNRVTDPNSLVNGVLVELQNPASDLASLDLRERDYTRTPVNIKNIFMENSHQSDSKLNLIPIDFSDFENCVIWIYENPSERETDLDSLELFAPTPNVPIPQSYIDCIVHGCLLYSTKFAEQFVKLTSGWHHAGNGCWVDDRNSEAAKYKRRPEVGETHAPDCDAIDTVLNNVLGTVFKRRRKFSV